MERRLAAILAADVVGYSRLMGEDEAGTLEALKALRKELVAPAIAGHKGRVVKLMGDGLLAEFGSVVEAVECAVAIQAGMVDRNDGTAQGHEVLLRIGINLGDVIVEGRDIYGDGVNVAARLEGLAEPGGICISDTVHQNVRAKLDLVFQDMGDQQVKNIAEPIHVYRIIEGGRKIAVSPSGAKPSPMPDKQSIAVLPFNNMSGDPEQEFFSDGISEDIITELSRFHSLFVTARNSSFAFKGQSVGVKEIGEKLGVAHVLEGSVRKAGGRVRITAQLIEAATGNHIWAERYDRDLADIFDVQDEVTQALVTIVAGRLANPSTGRSKRQHPESMTAYELVLRGKEHFQRNTKVENGLARDYFQKAIDLDPEYAFAHAWLAWTHCYDFELGWTRDHEQSSALALSCTKRATELDSADAWGQAALAYCYMYARQFDLGETHIERANKLNPNDADILAQKGLFLSYLGRPAEGVESLEMSRRRNPFGQDWSLWSLGIARYTAGQHEGAVAAWREMPNTPTEVFACLAASYAQIGQIDDAKRNMTAFLEHSQNELADYPGDDGAAWRDYWFKSFPYKNAENLEHLLDGLRKAGLPV